MVTYPKNKTISKTTHLSFPFHPQMNAFVELPRLLKSQVKGVPSTQQQQCLETSITPGSGEGDLSGQGKMKGRVIKMAWQTEVWKCPEGLNAASNTSPKPQNLSLVNRIF